ncbi:MAG TPA: hypothetical protein VGR70_06005, partial [Stellaceae bacterium]|nr:hypothetical protein [Stellaceae bacterium]
GWSVGRENVIVNIFDDLVADPAAMYRRTLAFLGVDPSFTTTFDVFNSNKIVRSHLVRAFKCDPPKRIKRA